MKKEINKQILNSQPTNFLSILYVAIWMQAIVVLFLIQLEFPEFLYFIFSEKFLAVTFVPAIMLFLASMKFVVETKKVDVMFMLNFILLILPTYTLIKAVLGLY